MGLLESYNRLNSVKDQGYQITDKDIDKLMTQKSRRKIEKELLKMEGRVNGKSRHREDNRLFPQWVQNVALAVAGLVHKF